MPEGENNIDALYNIDTPENEEKEVSEENLENGDFPVDEEEEVVEAAFNDNIPEE